MTKTTSTTRTGIAYLRVSTNEQGESGLGLEAQEASVRQWAATNGVEIVEIVTEIQSGKNLKKRPLLKALLERMNAGEVLIASNVSRLARSMSDLSGMLELGDRKGFEIAALDTGLDTSTPAGRMVIQILGVAAEYERAMTADRTTKALAAARARGTRLGRAPRISDEAIAFMAEHRAEGMTYEEIADELNRTLEQISENPASTAQEILVASFAPIEADSWNGDLVRHALKRAGQYAPGKRGPRAKVAAA
jgi:DNA invertase Pin-like site-specific DNA recombinase